MSDETQKWNLKKLYRRADAFLQGAMDDIHDIDEANPVYSMTIDFEEAPGWVAFDIRCKVANLPTGAPGTGYLTILVDGVEKARYRSSWQWTRHYLFVDRGPHIIEVGITNYAATDTAHVRNCWAAYFRELDMIKAIEQAQPPKPMEEINPIPILNGYTRYQGTGPRGTQVTFTIVIKGAEDWKRFMSDLQNDYILTGDEGLYGGVILPPELDQIKLGGNLYLIKCILHSASQAGVGC